LFIQWLVYKCWMIVTLLHLPQVWPTLFVCLDRNKEEVQSFIDTP